MTRKNRKFHFIYKTTNMLNEEFYVGMHSTDDLNDGYLGSGIRLRRSVDSYGRENFKFQILEFLEDRECLARREKEIITSELLRNPLCLNIANGGEGGWCNSPNSLAILRDPAVRARAGKASKETKRMRMLDETYSSNYKRKLSDAAQRHIKEHGHNWAGKCHSEETKKKMSESHVGKHDGEKNSQFGTCWINNGSLNKKIKKDELDHFLNLDEGWVKGRKMKF